MIKYKDIKLTMIKKGHPLLDRFFNPKETQMRSLKKYIVVKNKFDK